MYLIYKITKYDNHPILSVINKTISDNSNIFTIINILNSEYQGTDTEYYYIQIDNDIKYGTLLYKTVTDKSGLEELKLIKAGDFTSTIADVLNSELKECGINNIIYGIHTYTLSN